MPNRAHGARIALKKLRYLIEVAIATDVGDSAAARKICPPPRRHPKGVQACLHGVAQKPLSPVAIPAAAAVAVPVLASWYFSKQSGRSACPHGCECTSVSVGIRT